MIAEQYPDMMRNDCLRFKNENTWFRQDWMPPDIALTLTNNLLHETLQGSAISHKFPHLQTAGTHVHLSALISACHSLQSTFQLREIVWKCATPLMRTFVTDLLLMWCTVCRM
jgi:hypothetical protein